MKAYYIVKDRKKQKNYHGVTVNRTEGSLSRIKRTSFASLVSCVTIMSDIPICGEDENRKCWGGCTNQVVTALIKVMV